MSSSPSATKHDARAEHEPRVAPLVDHLLDRLERKKAALKRQYVRACDRYAGHNKEGSGGFLIAVYELTLQFLDAQLAACKNAQRAGRHLDASDIALDTSWSIDPICDYLT